MKYFLLVFILTVFTSCSEKMEFIGGETTFQKELNAEFKDVTKSPLKPKDRKEFKGLDFFHVDSMFVVKGYLKRTPDSLYFNMPTTSSRVSEERVFGIITFKIENEEYALNVYESKKLLTEAGYEDYLFLPFLDLTNGNASYGGGRYMDLRLKDKTKDTVLTIDFNKAYNPYCAYNDKYSCPIVPRENFINREIKAGVKAFKKDEGH